MRKSTSLLVVMMLLVVPMISGIDHDNPEQPPVQTPTASIDPATTDWAQMDWNSIEYSQLSEAVYSDSSFYSNCPASCYAQLDGLKIDYGNPNVNYDFLNYGTIDYGHPDIDYSKIDYDQAHYDKLDYSRVDYDSVQQFMIDAQKFADDLGCMACRLDLDGTSDEMVFSKNGITHPNGDFVSIPGSPMWPAGTSFTATEEGIVVSVHNVEHHNRMHPDEPFDIPKGDTIILDSNGERIITSTATIRGRVTFDKGSIIIPGDTPVEINDRAIIANNDIRYISDPDGDYLSMTGGGVEVAQLYITAPLGERETRVYFDSQERDFDQYIALDPTGDIFYARTQEYMQVNFLPDNIYFTTESEDNVAIELENGDVTVVSRDEQGYVPEVIVTQYSGPTSFAVENGLNIVSHYSGVDPGNIQSDYSLNGFTSTPFTLEIIMETPIEGAPEINPNEGEFYNPLAATYDGEPITRQIYFTNFNELVIVDRGSEEGIRLEEYDDLGARDVSTSLYYNYGNEYSKQQLEGKYGIPTSGSINPAVAKRLDDAMSQMTDDMLGTITEIFVLPDDEFAEVRAQYGGEHHEHSGAFTNAEGEIYFKESNLAVAVILEEAAHAKTVDFVGTDLAFQAQENYHNRKTVKSEHLDSYQTEGRHAFNQEIVFDTSEGFVWKDSQTSEPRGDCVSPYACSNVFEKIGQAAGKSPEEVAQMIDPDYNALGYDTMRSFYSQLCADGYWGGPESQYCYSLGLLTN